MIESPYSVMPPIQCIHLVPMDPHKPFSMLVDLSFLFVNTVSHLKVYKLMTILDVYLLMLLLCPLEKEVSTSFCESLTSVYELALVLCLMSSQQKKLKPYLIKLNNKPA